MSGFILGVLVFLIQVLVIMTEKNQLLKFSFRNCIKCIDMFHGDIECAITKSNLN